MVLERDREIFIPKGEGCCHFHTEQGVCRKSTHMHHPWGAHKLEWWLST